MNAHCSAVPSFEMFDGNDHCVGFGSNEDLASKELWRRAVHVFLINSSGQILIAKRPETARSYSGKWTSSAGGRVERNEAYNHAARRELLEELCVYVSLTDLGRFDVSDEHGRFIHHLFQGEYCGDDRSLKPDEREIVELKWVEPRHVLKHSNENLSLYAEPFRQAIQFYFKTKGEL
jgi:8-oxo-dGTP pyrophosphatase MutT (NUDIX family)